MIAQARSASAADDRHGSNSLRCGPHEKTRLQRDIDSTDRTIDEPVCDLYGLTKVEIAIVEQAAAPPARTLPTRSLPVRMRAMAKQPTGKRSTSRAARPVRKAKRAESAARAAALPLSRKKKAGQAATAPVAKPLNRSLHAAKATKQDEFYTQLPDIEKELKHYTKHFKGKTVLCNCDDPKVSNFFHYFSHKFHTLKLKQLITICYQNVDPDIFSKHDGKRGLRVNYNGERTPGGRVPSLKRLDTRALEGDGDFRSDECIELVKQADIVVTNPPFSLFREYVEQLVKYKKKFLVIANQNAITYKEIFSLIKANQMWLGYTHPVAFIVPDHYEMREVRSWRDENGINWRSHGNACWFTNMDIQKRHEELITFCDYDPKKYPMYDNYHAIEVSRYKDIPGDYDGVMGVPVTFLAYYNPDQFEIVGSDYEVRQGLLPELVKRSWTGKIDRGYVNGKRKFARILIRKRAK